MEQIDTLIQLIQKPEVQDFMRLHAKENPAALSLKYNAGAAFELAPIIRQITLRQKAVHKLGSFLQPETILLPKLFEQSTNEQVAAYKSTLIKGNTLLDGTAGLGIDTFHIGQNFKAITCIEANAEHAVLLKHNLSLHGLHPNIIHDTLEAFLHQNKSHFDVIYIDPDRRPDAGIRQYDLEECTPNVAALKEKLLEYGSEVWIKLSPMMDIQAIVMQFGTSLKKIYNIAFQNEMKEILICLKANNEAPLHCAVNITNEGLMYFESQDLNAKPILSTPGKYFFEPNVALIKSRLAMPYAIENNLGVLYPNGYYFTTNQLFPNNQGRFFEVEQAGPYKPEELKVFIKKKDIKQANISCRNFFWKPEEVKKQLKLSDGGEWYLYCYTDGDKKPLALWCRRPKK